MNILRPIDIEEEIRLALKDYLTAYVRPLPANFTTPCILITATGGSTAHTIDTFTVTIDARAESDAGAYELLSTALGLLEAQARAQFGALRNATINSLARWGNDPVRPDLKLCTATVLVTAHRQTATIPEESKRRRHKVMSNVLVGAGNATGMFYVAPKGTALPSTPGASLGADWTEVGAITEDGITFSLPNGDVMRNWALVAERKINTENGTVQAPIMYTTKKVLETLFGANNITHIAADSTHGNVDSVTLSPDVSAEQAAYLFLMKDGEKLAMLGCSDGLITEIGDVTFNASSGATWEATIDGTWTFAVDDGQVASGS